MEKLFGWGFSELKTDTVDYLYNVPDNSSYVRVIMSLWYVIPCFKSYVAHWLHVHLQSSIVPYQSLCNYASESYVLFGNCDVNKYIIFYKRIGIKGKKYTCKHVS